MSISVAMCTYNGARYLEQQLEGIAEQSLLPEELIICDDGSTDRTLELINQFVKRAPFSVKIINNKRLGVVKNFEMAISLCSGSYIALCDQDDLWKNDRLVNQIKLLENAENRLGSSVPLLTYSDLQLVDSSGKPMGKTFFQASHIHPVSKYPYRTFAVLNIAPGCGMVINRALVSLALPISDDAVMHDWWLALIASVAGEVIFSDSLSIGYRQHEANLRGVSDNFSNLIMKSLSPIKLLKKQRCNYSSSVDQFISAAKILDKNGISLPDELLSYRQSLIRGGIHRIFPLLRGDISRQDFLKTLSYLMGIFLNYNKQNNNFSKSENP